MKHVVLLVILSSFCNGSFSQEKSNHVNLRINGDEKILQLDGFGVNINTAWWYNGQYGNTKHIQPAIDLLIDSLGAAVFRAVIEEIDWEQVNDDNDPDHFNWSYYNKIFTNARFQGVWNTLHYLNSRGIKNNSLVLSLMGGPPAAKPLARPSQKLSWMGRTDYSISNSMEDEFVESIAALLYYARHNAKIDFTLVSPMNETEMVTAGKSADHPNGIVEGPNIPDALQFVRIIKKLGQKLDAIGMSDIRFMSPDAAGDHLFGSCFQEMVKDPYVMSKLAWWGVHDYGSTTLKYDSIINTPGNSNKIYWVTETAGINNLFGLLDGNAKAFIFWDGFDCVYQHARRNGYGDIPPNDWVFWQPEDGKPLLEYIPATREWKPRKQFYQFAQIFRFIKPGATRISSTRINEMAVHSFINPDGQIAIAGFNNSKDTIRLNAFLDNIPLIRKMQLVVTNAGQNLHNSGDIKVMNNVIDVGIPPGTVFTLSGYPDTSLTGPSGFKPEPADWFAGDMHVHRNCGEGTSILSENDFVRMMELNDLAVISVLADMGDGEVKDIRTDLPKVDGSDEPQSKPGRIVHYDAEWHFDPAGTTFEHKALGGHIVMLGLHESHTIWDESTYKILEWGKKQNAIMGFCHMQYLKDSIPAVLDCCTPIDFPVEAALGTIDFLAEDVWLNDASVRAYYRLLNCGFRLGWAAGTDFPCNNSRPFGSLLTYVQVKDKPLTYSAWIEGIKNGRTVVTTNGHIEFLDIKINGTATPGDEIRLSGKGTVEVEAVWSSKSEQTGRIELVLNGKVIATKPGSSGQGAPLTLKYVVPVKESSWVCARRMDESGHRSHTAPVYITLAGAPVRASAEDARYFIGWIDTVISNISAGGPWNMYFSHDQDIVQSRYLRARSIYEEIAKQADKRK